MRENWYSMKWLEKLWHVHDWDYWDVIEMQSEDKLKSALVRFPICRSCKKRQEPSIGSWKLDDKPIAWSRLWFGLLG
jgi:hypothetical protein